MNKCRVLAEYSEFVDIARRYIAEGMDRQEAFNETIDYCIDHNILSEFLKKNRAEVLGMLLETFDVKKYERSLRAEGFEEGKEEGLLEGREEGRQEESERLHKLIIILSEQNRMDDLVKAAHDEDYQEQLFREFNLL